MLKTIIIIAHKIGNACHLIQITIYIYVRQENENLPLISSGRSSKNIFVQNSKKNIQGKIENPENYYMTANWNFSGGGKIGVLDHYGHFKGNRGSEADNCL